MSTHFQPGSKPNSQLGDAHRHRFATPLRRAFKRLKVTRKKTTSGAATPTVGLPLADFTNGAGRSDVPTQGNVAGLGEGLNPPPAPRPFRLASPAVPMSPVSPLPVTASRSSNLLTIRSGRLGVSDSQNSIQGLVSDDAAPSSSSPPAPMPRGSLFQLGLTPVQSVRSMQSAASYATATSSGFAPALQATQRVSTVNLAYQTAGVDMMDIVDMDLDPHSTNPGEITPTPPSRTSSDRWLPPLAVDRRVMSNSSTAAVFEGSHLVGERRRTSFMSKLVGSAWGLAGMGFNSIHNQRRSTVAPPIVDENMPVMGSLPSIPLGKGSIEQAVFGDRRASVMSQRSGRLSNDLPPANSTMRMTGSKSGRALEEFENEPCASGPVERSKLEERPKKKMRNCVNQHFIRSTAPSPTTARVTRAMAARQVEESTTPTRVTRSASKRLSELADTPRSSYDGAARRPKSLKRL